VSDEHNKLAVVPDRGLDRFALEPGSMAETFKLAMVIAEAKLFKIENANDAVVRILAGRELGLPAITSLRALFSFDGQVGLYAVTKETLTRRSPSVEFLRQVSSTDTECVYEAKRVGEERVYESKWTIARAKIADLVKPKSAWEKFPQQMLRARARSEICDIVDPSAALGLPTMEEMTDRGALTINPETGEILGGLKEERPKGRDYRREVDEVKLKISAAKDTEEARAEIIREVEALRLPEPFVTEVRDAYGAKFQKRQPAKAAGAAKEKLGAPAQPTQAQTPTSPTPADAPRTREPGED
jgi:hypothetical protein